MITGSFASGALPNNRQFPLRILTGVWCLACFVLVTAYSSVLIACITAPDKFKPIINSVNDLPNKPDIHVTVDKNLFLDVVLQVIQNLLLISNQYLVELTSFIFKLKLISGRCERRRCHRNIEIFGRRFKTTSGESLSID